MNTRSIPSSGEKLPVVGLGTWQQFDVGASDSERDPLREVLRRMVEYGGRVIDSSPMYGNAETVIGDLTSELDSLNRFFYATKVWTAGEEEGIEEMETSMRRMRRRTMDLMQIHNLVDWKTHLRTLRNRKTEGRIRYIGITHYTESSHDELERILRKEPLDFVQFNYSIRVRNAERTLLNTARDRGVAVLINEPFEKGVLFTAVKGITLPAWASEYEIDSWAQFFLKYLLSLVIENGFEEKNLEKRFGDACAEYRKRVGRYWPNVRRGGGAGRRGEMNVQGLPLAKVTGYGGYDKELRSQVKK